MFRDRVHMVMKIENVELVGSFFMQLNITRINKGGNTLFGFFLILRVY